MEKGKRRPGRYVDTRTRHKGVYARHRISCALANGGAECDCKPSYYRVVWDRSAGAGSSPAGGTPQSRLVRSGFELAVVGHLEQRQYQARLDPTVAPVHLAGAAFRFDVPDL